MRLTRTTLLFLALSSLLVTSSAWAGGGYIALQPSAPPVHKFFARQNIALLGVSALIMTADIATTRRALQAPGSREMNPLAQSPAALDTLKLAGFGAGLGISYLMHRTGHYKAERFALMLLAAPSAVAALHNAGIQR